MNLENKRIVITGATAGIGYCLLKNLVSENQVIAIARSERKLHELNQQFENVITYQADLSRTDEVEAVADSIVKNFDSVDILINNAAEQNTPTFLDEDFQYHTIAREIAVNFTSICSLTYLLLPCLLHQNRAVIMNINSGLALAPKTSSSVYCATKGALNNFTLSLRYQLEQTNIDVYQAFLELVDTAMTEGRGTRKMSAEHAARLVIEGIRRDIQDHDIGKVKLLRSLLRIAPGLAQKIMKKH